MNSYAMFYIVNKLVIQIFPSIAVRNVSSFVSIACRVYPFHPFRLFISVSVSVHAVSMALPDIIPMLSDIDHLSRRSLGRTEVKMAVQFPEMLRTRFLLSWIWFTPFCHVYIDFYSCTIRIWTCSVHVVPFVKRFNHS